MFGSKGPPLPSGVSLFTEHETLALNTFFDTVATDKSFLSLGPRSDVVEEKQGDLVNIGPVQHSALDDSKNVANSDSSDGDNTLYSAGSKARLHKSASLDSLGRVEDSAVSGVLELNDSEREARKKKENLTMDQRRVNHINSEQKRRDQIKEGYADLERLVPGLRGLNASKSAALKYTAEYIVNLEQGNKAISKLLYAEDGVSDGKKGIFVNNKLLYAQDGESDGMKGMFVNNEF
jgi:hypothetical protein